jgi:hypothetical protein
MALSAIYESVLPFEPEIGFVVVKHSIGSIFPSFCGVAVFTTDGKVVSVGIILCH